MKRSLLQMICKGCKNLQRTGSKVLRSFVKNLFSDKLRWASNVSWALEAKKICWITL